MSELPHIPVLRRGRTYESLDQVDVAGHRDGVVLAKISQANAGLIRKDLSKIDRSRAALNNFTCAELIDITKKAGELFMNGSLPLGDQGHMQSPEDYTKTLSATSGLPHAMVRRNMAKVYSVMAEIETILKGLTRNLNLEIIDKGLGIQDGMRMSFYPVTQSLGLVLPSNSPGVNSLWIPAIPLKIPVILKPGREEPWTPYRIMQAFIAAGCPAEAFGFYPTDHEGAGEILKSCGRALIFGDKSTTDRYANNPAVQVHGPGYSKIVIGEDQVEKWPEFIDIMVSSISDNGGRSCINASAVVTPKYGKEIADALAQKLGPIEPAEPDDENAKLSGFANPKMAEFIDATIEDGLETEGAEDVTAKYRGGPRRTEKAGGAYLRPTVIHCDTPEHPLFNREFLCPYAAVVEVPQEKMLEAMGPSLVVTAITEDPAFRSQLLASPLIERLNLGPVSTMKVSWDQPHEGNLFEFLYHRRAIEMP